MTNLARTLTSLADLGVWIYGLAEKGDQNLNDISFSGSVAIVLGSEGLGLRRLTIEKCDHLVTLPTSAIFTTLNVAVACGISLYAVFNRRK